MTSATQNNNEQEHGSTSWVKRQKTKLIIGGLAFAGIVGGIIIADNWSTITKGMQNLFPCSKIISTVSKAPQVVSKAPISFGKIPIKVCSEPVNKILNLGEEFEVSRHIRALPDGWNASPSKVARAAEYGIELVGNQTWVDNYIKNCA